MLLTATSGCGGAANVGEGTATVTGDNTGGPQTGESGASEGQEHASDRESESTSETPSETSIDVSSSGSGQDSVSATSTSTGAEAESSSEGEGSANDEASGDEPFQGKELFILFGQSNMSGMSPMPPEPWPIRENVTFMVQYDCPSLGQTKDEWLPAQPPLHGCQWATNGIGLGLADSFGAALAEAWPDAQIGLIPNAIPAVTIDVFMKDGPSPGGGMRALPDGYTSAYALMVERVRDAQQLGRVRAILLHQGESDYNQGMGDEWLGKLAIVVADLRQDLGLGEDVPFIAGQISPASMYSGHNVNIDRVPEAIPNAAVVSSEGTDIHDIAHFDLMSARIMGERYAAMFLELVGDDGP